MRKVRDVVAVLVLGIYGSVLGVVSARDVVAAQDAGARVVILPIADAPVTLDSGRVATDPSRVAFTTRNTGPKNIRAYIVSVFWFPPAGQRHGFKSQQQEPSAILRRDDAHQAIMSLPEGMQLGSDMTLIVAVRSATFEDGTEWKPSMDEINARVTEKAHELKLE
jgi:hypothetical protein